MEILASRILALCSKWVIVANPFCQFQIKLGLTTISAEIKNTTQFLSRISCRNWRFSSHMMPMLMRLYIAAYFDKNPSPSIIPAKLYSIRLNDLPIASGDRAKIMTLVNSNSGVSVDITTLARPTAGKVTQPRAASRPAIG